MPNFISFISLYIIFLSFYYHFHITYPFHITFIYFRITLNHFDIRITFFTSDLYITSYRFIYITSELLIIIILSHFHINYISYHFISLQIILFFYITDQFISTASNLFRYFVFSGTTDVLLRQKSQIQNFSKNVTFL